jgi:hypothetical protein
MKINAIKKIAKGGPLDDFMSRAGGTEERDRCGPQTRSITTDIKYQTSVVSKITSPSFAIGEAIFYIFKKTKLFEHLKHVTLCHNTRQRLIVLAAVSLGFVVVSAAA